MQMIKLAGSVTVIVTKHVWCYYILHACKFYPVLIIDMQQQQLDGNLAN